MRVCIETHCHSLYSHDSNMAIERIAVMGESYGLNHIIICDHDIFGLVEDDLRVLNNHGIIAHPAIEFTTQEGVHIIGVHQNIKKIEKLPKHYSVREIISLLLSIGAIIIIPHPYHVTGIIGNGKVSELDIDFCLRNSHFLEISNYKYGMIDSKLLLSKYTNLKCLVGSDAHSADAVAGQFNFFDVPDDIESDKVLDYVFKNQIVIEHRFRLKHGRAYWVIKNLKKSGVYQFLLNLFPVSLRKSVKNKLINR